MAGEVVDEETWTIEVKPTVSDLRRSMLFTASGSKRSFAFWSPARTKRVVSHVAVIAFYCYLEISHPLYGNVGPLVIGLFTLLLANLIFRLDIALWRLVRSDPSLLEPYTVTVTPEYWRAAGTSSESYLRWPVFVRIDHSDGDILVYISPELGTLIPLRAFAGREDANRFYKTITAYRDDAVKKTPIAPSSLQLDNSVWPPPPASTVDSLPLPGGVPVGDDSVQVSYMLSLDDYMALGAVSPWPYVAIYSVIFVLVVVFGPLRSIESVGLAFIAMCLLSFFSISSARRVRRDYLRKCWNIIRMSLCAQTISTDFKRLVLSSAESVYACDTARCISVRKSRSHLFIRVSALSTIAIPYTAFASPASADEFAEKMSNAIAERKRSRRLAV